MIAIIRYRHDAKAAETVQPVSEFDLVMRWDNHGEEITNVYVDAFQQALCQVNSSQGGYVEEWHGSECRRVHPRRHQPGKPPKKG